MIRALLPTIFMISVSLSDCSKDQDKRDVIPTQPLAKIVAMSPNQSSLYQTAEQLRRPAIWEIDRSNPFEADEYNDEEYQEYDDRNLTPNTMPETLAAPCYSLTNFVVAPGVVRFAPDQSGLYSEVESIAKMLGIYMKSYNPETDPDNIENYGYDHTQNGWND